MPTVDVFFLAGCVSRSRPRYLFSSSRVTLSPLVLMICARFSRMSREEERQLDEALSSLSRLTLSKPDPSIQAEGKRRRSTTATRLPPSPSAPTPFSSPERAGSCRLTNELVAIPPLPLTILPGNLASVADDGDIDIDHILACTNSSVPSARRFGHPLCVQNWRRFACKATLRT